MRGFGIIGGGAVLFTATALAGQPLIPMIGEKCLHIRLKCPLLLFLLDDANIYSTISRHWNSRFTPWRRSSSFKGNVQRALLQVVSLKIMNDVHLMDTM